MKEIELTRGQVALVDDDDFEWLSQFKWYAQKSGEGFYAHRGDYSSGKRRVVCMHRIILDAPISLQVDHANGDGLDNQKINLRLATSQQNGQNKRHPLRNNRLGIKGVYWNKKRKKYQAVIKYNGKQINLGRFSLLADADKAYRNAEAKYFGNFARQIK